METDNPGMAPTNKPATEPTKTNKTNLISNEKERIPNTSAIALHS
jgi:hypothetical protein